MNAIKFTPEMVRAILDGRKCQTRRLEQKAGAGDKLYIDAPLPPQFARVVLKITGVWKDPLRAISYEDVVAEGFEGRFEFADYWNSIYGNRPGCAWSDNPVVWVHQFEIVAIDMKWKEAKNEDTGTA